MTDKKITEIASMLSGLKRYEWSRIKVAVEKQFDSASAKLELTDTESLEKKLRIEFLGTIQ